MVSQSSTRYFAPTELWIQLIANGSTNISSPRGLKKMSGNDNQDAEVNTNEPDQAELAHSIIESLLDHTRIVSDLIALMAQALDDDTQKALTQTPQWNAYLESRRKLETTRSDVEKFVEELKHSANE